MRRLGYTQNLNFGINTSLRARTVSRKVLNQLLKSKLSRNSGPIIKTSKDPLQWMLDHTSTYLRAMLSPLGKTNITKMVELLFFALIEQNVTDYGRTSCLDSSPVMSKSSLISMDYESK